ncbi:MAG: LacI family DNA-binding transcriptional regulator [Anaerolineales bacterium]|nr:LacI family DNA-binding transcriptional regulator [Anaerolineales bacterium]
MAHTGTTIRDVAALAGVSHQTVSRVINNNDGVRPETKARVEAAIQELNYIPSASARSMARGHSFMLACLVPNLIDYTFGSIIEGGQMEACQNNYLLVSSSAPDEPTFAALMDEFAASRRVDGLVVVNPYMDNRTSLIPQGFPVIFTGSRSQDPKISSIALNDFEAGRTATRFLLESGHDRLCTITGPMIEDCSRDRLRGFQQQIRDAGLPEDNIIMHGDWTASSAYHAFSTYLKEHEAPCAVFAQNDQMAIGLIRAAHEYGLNVPVDLSVIGIDDMPLASFFTPALTTLRQDMTAIGKQAIQLLLHTIEHPDAPAEHISISPELVIRQSVSRK